MKNITNSKILVTGGAGFIGSHLVDNLLSQNYTVRVLDNLSNGSRDNLQEALKNPNFEFIKGDIVDKSTCKESMQGINIVFHLACLGVRHSLHSPYENQRVNTEGTFNILQAALNNKIGKFFYISSSEIYGKVKTFPITEEAIPEPTTIYAASKLAGEVYAKAFYESFGLDVTIFRLFNNYGPRAHYEGDAGELIPRTIVNTLYNQPPVIFGDGKFARDFIYVKDTAKILSSFINNDTIIGDTINIGVGIEYSVKDIVKNILKLMHKQNLEINYLLDRPGDTPRLWVDPIKFNMISDTKPSYSFEEGLKETIKYYEELKKTKNLIESVKPVNWEE